MVAHTLNNFYGDLDCRYIDGKGWKVLADFKYHVDAPDGNEFIAIGDGFITDFASIPRLIQLLWKSPGGPWDKPAVIHDCLYQTGMIRNVDGTTRRVTRDEADKIFLQAMEVTGTHKFTRRAIYRGVRVGGWYSWRKYRKAEHERRIKEASGAASE